MHKSIDKLAWINIKNGKLLVARPNKHEKFVTPGRERLEGVSDEQALIREVNEDFTVDIKPCTIKKAATLCATADGDAGEVHVQMQCFYADFVGDIKPADDEVEYCYLSHKKESDCSEETQLVIDWLKSEGRMY